MAASGTQRPNHSAACCGRPARRTRLPVAGEQIAAGPSAASPTSGRPLDLCQAPGKRAPLPAIHGRFPAARGHCSPPGRSSGPGGKDCRGRPQRTGAHRFTPARSRGATDSSIGWEPEPGALEFLSQNQMRLAESARTHARLLARLRYNEIKSV